ncbi:MAG TPA: hemerythrin domain-containing protein [Streptosporangiaceae bacterium]|jgi:hypothetical protein
MPDGNDEIIAAPPARARALGAELVRIHDGLRRELAGLLADVEDVLAGRSADLPAPASGLGAQLSERCVAVCGDIRVHHATEAGRGFTRLEARFPELAPVLDQLRREHEVLAAMRRRVEETFGTGDAHRIHGALRRLAADLDVHFHREEEQLVAALNAL